MSYKAILSTRHPTKEALLSYYERKCKEIEYAVAKYYDHIEKNRLDKAKELIERKKQRTTSKRLKNEEIKYKSAIKSLKTGEIEIKKKPTTLAQARNKAYSRFQKRKRLNLADRHWMIYTMDTKKYVRRNQKGIVSWHYRSKHNHPNIWFESMNVRPISTQTNRMQWDQPWYYRKDNLINHIWQEKFDELEALSKLTDNIIRDRKYWEDMESVRKEAFEDCKNERIVNGRAV